jgi:hypothetical protein
LYEGDSRVGEVFVPQRDPAETRYVEHWVLYPNYRYPGPRYLGALRVVVSTSEAPYASEDDFFRNVPFAKGSKYVRVNCQESPALP